MPSSQIPCPNCGEPVEIHEDAVAASCAACGRVIVVERVTLAAGPAGRAPAPVEKEVPAAPADKASALGVLLMILSFIAGLASLSAHLFWLWITAAVLFLGGAARGVIGMKGNKKERVGAVAIVGFIALFFVFTGFTQTW